MNLFDLSEKYIALREMMLNPDVDQQAVEDTLEALDGAIEEKADGIAYVCAEFEAQAALAKSESDRLKERAKAATNGITRLREYLKQAMIKTGKPNIKTALHNFSIGKYKSVDIIDESLVPAEYLKTETKPMKAEMLKALKEGIEIPGAELKENESVKII